MGTSDLLYLALLFGVWLVVVAVVNYISVRREVGGRWTPGVRTLCRGTLALGIGLVVAYLSVALPAFQFLPMETSYSIIVAAFAVSGALQAALFLPSLVRARRLRIIGS
jgi:hypothetical protein